MRIYREVSFFHFLNDRKTIFGHSKMFNRKIILGQMTYKAFEQLIAAQQGKRMKMNCSQYINFEKTTYLR